MATGQLINGLYRTMKNILIVLVMLLASHAYGQDTGNFYVIPVIKNVEVCNGEPIGQNSFVLDVEGGPSLRVKDVYSTDKGFLIQITGVDGTYVGASRYSYNWYSSGGNFRKAPSSLPAPNYGSKGPYYYLSSGGSGGGLVFAKYL